MRTLFFCTIALALLFASKAGAQERAAPTGVGVDVSLDVETIIPTKRADGTSVYLVKLLCGTITHLLPNVIVEAVTSDRANALQQPGVPDELVPGTYLSKFSILNPQADPVVVSLATGPFTLGSLGTRTLRCKDFILDFIPATEFQELSLAVVSSKELNVTAVRTLKNAALTAVVVCDVDLDGDVDLDDINAIFAKRNTPTVPGDPHDADGDKKITVNDARKCVLKCTRPGCAP